MKTMLLAAGAALGLLAAASPAGAYNAVLNGGFESTTNGVGQFDNNTSATNWTSNGYNFIFAGTTSDSVGSNGQYGNLKLWGPANGSNNGLGPSANGGNFVGADGAFGVAPIEQTIHGLHAGLSYVVGFEWGGIQQYGFNGVQDEHWDVSLGGGAAQSTATYFNTNHGFSGWSHQAFTFVAQHEGDNVLSFLAVGHPGGVPPFSLLDGVSLNVGVPEPATWAMLIGGFGLVGAAARRRRMTTVAA